MDASAATEAPVERLARQLRSAESDEIRIGVISELGELGDRRAIDLIAPFLDSDDVWTRTEACAALGRVDGAEAAPHLRRAVRDEDTLVRGRAIAWLGHQRDVESIPEIASILDEGSRFDRMEARWALGEIGDVAAEAALRGARKRTWRPWRKLALQRTLRRSHEVRRERGPAVPTPRPDPEYARLLVERAAQRSTYLGERPARNQAVVDAVTEVVGGLAEAGLATVEVRDIPAPLQAGIEVRVRPRLAGSCPITVRVEGVWMYVIRLGNDGATIERTAFGARGQRRSLKTIRNVVQLAIEGGYEEYVHRDPASGQVKVTGDLSRRGWVKEFADRNTKKRPREDLERRGWEHIRYGPYDPDWNGRPPSHDIVVDDVARAVRDVLDRGLATIEVSDAPTVRDEPITEVEVRPPAVRHCPIKVRISRKSEITLMLGRHEADAEVLGLTLRRRLRTLAKRIDSAIAGEYKEYVRRDPRSGTVRVRGELRSGESPGERFGNANTLRWDSLGEQGWEYFEYAPYDAAERPG